MTENQLMKLKKSDLVKMIQERSDKVVIVSDGTLTGTKLYREGEPVNNMTRIGFIADTRRGIKTWVEQHVTAADGTVYQDEGRIILFDQGIN